MMIDITFCNSLLFRPPPPSALAKILWQMRMRDLFGTGIFLFMYLFAH